MSVRPRYRKAGGNGGGGITDKHRLSVHAVGVRKAEKAFPCSSHGRTHTSTHENSSPRRRPFCRKSIAARKCGGAGVCEVDGYLCGIGCICRCRWHRLHQTARNRHRTTATRGNAGKTRCGRASVKNQAAARRIIPF